MKPHSLPILLLLITLLTLCACGGPEPVAATAAPTLGATAPVTESTAAPTTLPATEPPTEPPTEPVFQYAQAVEDHLLPLEDYAWERSHAPEFVMIHFISAVVNHRDDPYNMDYIRDIFVDYNLSVHYIIERDGTVRCYIPENLVAWHAGKGEFGDPKYTNNMNHYAIGIEVVAIGSEADMADMLTAGEYRALDDSLKGFTQAQYDSLKLLVADLCRRYDIPMDRDHVIGHEEYSPQKTDPGELFDWTRLFPES